MPTIPFPHVSWLQLAAPPVPTRALKNIIIQEFYCDNLDDAIAAVLAPETAPFPREDPSEPEEPRPIPLCLQEQTPWPFRASKVSSAPSAICRVITRQDASIPSANVDSENAQLTAPTRTNPTQERPPPELRGLRIDSKWASAPP